MSRAVSDPSPVPGTRTIDTGYVFVDGEYVPPPYQVMETDAGVTINGILLTADFPTPGSGQGPGWGGWPANGRGKGDSFNRPAGVNRMGVRPFRGRQLRVMRWLEEESVLVAFAGQPLIILDGPDLVRDFLRVVRDPDISSPAFQHLIGEITNEELRQSWTKWLVSYRRSDGLRERANAIVNAADAAEAENLAAIAAVRRLDSIAYPASLVGMVLAVLATGHLLSSLPARDRNLSEGTVSREIGRATMISVALIFCLSALDLAWTVLAAQAGQMRELNPIGHRLLENPISLVAFKSSATLMSCGLLLTLRGYHIARLASWWLCLVCTILTFRWLAFHSLLLGS